MSCLVVFFFLPTWAISLALIVLMLTAIYAGFRIGSYRRNRSPKPVEDTGSGSQVSALFGLSAFILGFTFSMASARYESRRSIMVDEVNNIGTAYLRTDLYPDSIGRKMKGLFRDYVDERINYWENSRRDTALMNASINRSNKIAMEIWKMVMDYSRQPNGFVPTSQMTPAMNAVIDIVTKRNQTYLNIVPEIIVGMLFMLTICSAFLSGYSNKGTGVDWTVAIGFSLLSSLVIYITLDLDRSKRGVITLKEQHQLMVDFRKSIE
ncbi:hypothetical protein KJS94_13015 [Flavihumibacter rivuli]|uniref:bestrophin-like domain n=1 Tax=Flavihumibacter rivuli TaxID=2838156 RepID=UPI001BDEF8D8|nr:hypothetical protein [Flavihumibacter rivuli]ULQ55566.1 hypothetical protein KJS94_13015 [Flavihumibacter rivuli]